MYVSSKEESSAVTGTIQVTRFYGALEELKIILRGGSSITAQVPKGVALESGFAVGKRVFVNVTSYHVFVG